MDNRKVSLCITTWNRYEQTLNSFVHVAQDPRIDEIVIVDDFSDIEIYERLKIAIEFCDKVKLFRNTVNLDCYLNKKRAVELASNDWIILIDSDNEIGVDYLDNIFCFENWDTAIAYMPSFAKPLFDYRQYDWLTFTKENISEYMDKPMVTTCLNCMNYFINKHTYLNVWDGSINPHTADSIFQNYNLLKNGNGIFIVPNLHYTHNVHDGSHYKLNNHKTGNLYKEIEDKLRQLK